MLANDSLEYYIRQAEMRYWLLMGAALVGGFLLLNGALSDLHLLTRVQVFVAVLLIGGGRRMLQERVHR